MGPEPTNESRTTAMNSHPISHGNTRANTSSQRVILLGSEITRNAVRMATKP